MAVICVILAARGKVVSDVPGIFAGREGRQTGAA